MAIYMKYGNIKGPVTTDGFKDWIEVGSFQWGSGRAIHSATGRTTSREHSAPNFSEVTVRKQTDLSSPKLFLESAAGKLNNKVILKFTTTSKGDVATFLTYELTDCGLSGYAVTSDGDIPSESLRLNYTKIMTTFADPETGVSPETVGYDLTKMKTV
jgi:type VI secretion system secreted protein Hcp